MTTTEQAPAAEVNTPEVEGGGVSENVIAANALAAVTGEQIAPTSQELAADWQHHTSGPSVDQ